MSRPEFDLLIKNVRVVRPHGNVVHDADIAITGGKIAKVAPGIDPARASEVFDGNGRLAFPGVVDAHMHSGIYSPLEEDAVSESKAAAMGGVTSSLNYFRTGQYYLNKGGPLRQVLPGSAQDQQGPLPRRLRLPPGADGQDAHRRDPDADREARRGELQDLHVLRLARAARRERFAARVPDDRQGRALRRRALRVHHARHAGGAREDARARAADLAVAALRNGGDHDGLHQDRREGQVAQGPGGLQRVAPAALRRPGRVHRRLPGQRDRAAQHQPAAPELAQGGAGGADDGRRVPAHRLPARGDDRPPDARHRPRRPRSWPR